MKLKTWLIGVALFVQSSLVLGVELVQNGGFETGDLTGWTADINASGVASYAVYNGPPSHIAGDPNILSAPEGSFAAYADQDSPSSLILYQDVPIPANAGTVNFSAIIFLHNRAGDYFNPVPDSLEHTDVPNQQFRVDIMDPGAPIRDIGAGVLLPVFATTPGDALDSGYLNLTANLSAFAGQTVRLRFALADTEFFFHAGVDAVSVDAQSTATGVPAAGPLALALLSLLFGGLGLRYSAPNQR